MHMQKCAITFVHVAAERAIPLSGPSDAPDMYMYIVSLVSTAAYLTLLHFIGGHDNDTTVLLPNHLPKVRDGFRKTSLCIHNIPMSQCRVITILLVLDSMLNYSWPVWQCSGVLNQGSHHWCSWHWCSLNQECECQSLSGWLVCCRLGKRSGHSITIHVCM